ncbi:alpha/beta hydrolase [Polaromonas sp. P1-6]|nr:alpha/beta hydrolase [Polaromonas sp. P1-6]
MPEVKPSDESGREGHLRRSRPTVVMLPGLLCDEAVWEQQTQALADAANCIVPDYGLDASITAMARRVLEEVDEPSACVVGHSMGGRIALEMARLAPGRIARIALLDTGFQARPAGTSGETEKRERLSLLQLARDHGMREMGRRWARGMVQPANLNAPVFEAILSMIERKTPAVFEAQIQALLDRTDAGPVLQALRCPTLLLCGRHDAWSPLTRHREMQAMLPHSELVVIEDAGHMTTMEQPEAVSAALLHWLEA